jgi:CDP-glucose 4,6-dehydratase
MEIAVTSYRRSFFEGSGVRVASVRAGNVLGGGDWAAGRIVPDAVRALAAGEKLLVRNPHAVRPWQHVLEPLSGYLWVGAKLAGESGGEYTTAWNFGPAPTQLHTVAELADALVKSWGRGAWGVYESRNAPHEAGLLKLAIDRARLRLGWEPVWNFDATVRRTVDWYRKFYEAPDDAARVHAACVADIESYEADARTGGVAWTS